MVWILLTIFFACIIAIKSKTKLVGAVLCIPSAISAAAISSAILYLGEYRNAMETFMAVTRNSVIGFVISLIVMFIVKYRVSREEDEYSNSYIAGVDGRILGFDFEDFSQFLDGNPSKEKIQEYASALLSAGAKKDDILEIMAHKLGKENVNNIYL